MTNSYGFGVFGILAGLGGLGFAIWQTKKADDLAKKIDSSLSDLESKTVVDVSNDVVDKAIRSAAEHAVERAVNEAKKEVIREIRTEVKNQVRKEVDANVKRIGADVTDEIAERVANIDEAALQERITKRAEDMVVKKFDGSLNSVLSDFKRQMGNVTKVWEYVADSTRPKSASGSGMTFRFGE